MGCADHIGCKRRQVRWPGRRSLRFASHANARTIFFHVAFVDFPGREAMSPFGT
jgi:hypothetical protein